VTVDNTPQDRARPLIAIGVLAAVLALGGLVALHGSRREGTRTGWTEIGAADPRVAGVFHTLDQLGLAPALDSLAHQARRDSLVLRAGHQLAHALGRRAFASAGQSDTVIRHCRPDFGSGCYHGVVEASLAHHDVAMDELERMCASAGSDPHSGSLFECVHGVGHGVLGAVGGDVARALHDCDELSSDALRGSCHEGVFMEAITTAVGGHQHHAHGGPGMHGTSLALDPRDPFSPCRAYQDRYGQACWIFQGFVILRAVQFDARRALHICDRAPSGWAVRCYQSVGHQLTGLFQRDNRWVIDRCRSGQPELGAQCAAGVVLALVAIDWSGRRALEFCGQVPRPWQAACRDTYEDRIAALRSQSRSP
jgi:hypothetical protein